MQPRRYPQLGRAGIDTSFERQWIHYRPRLAYTAPPLPAVPTDGDAIATPLSSPDGGDPAEESVTDALNDIQDAMENLESIDQELEEALKHVSAPIPDNQRDTIVRSARQLGYTPSVGIPYALYRDSFWHEGSAAATHIQRAFEQYHQQVDGDVRTELTADVQGLLQDWEDLLALTRQALMPQVVNADEVPSSLEDLEDASALLKEAEERQVASYRQDQSQYLRQHQELREQERHAPMTDSFFDAQESFAQTEQSLQAKEKRLQTKARMVTMLKDRAADTDTVTRQMRRILDETPIERDAPSLALSILEDRQHSPLRDKLKHMEVLMQSAMDKDIQRIQESAAHFDGIGARSSKQRTNKSMGESMHLQSDVVDPLFTNMEYLDPPETFHAMNQMASYLTDALIDADQSVSDQQQDFYQVHASDADARIQRLEAVTTKHNKRMLYRVIRRLRQEGEARGWPSTTDVDAFVEGISWPSKEDIHE